MNETTHVMSERLWSLSDLADFLQVPVESIRKWRARGEGPRAYLIGKHLRFDPSDVHAWLEEQRADAPPRPRSASASP